MHTTHRVCHDLGLDLGAKIKPVPSSEDWNFLNIQRESYDPKFICHKISLKIHNFQKNFLRKTKILATLRRTPAAKSGGAKKQKKDTVEVCPILSTWTSISNTALSTGGTWPIEWVRTIPGALTMLWVHLTAILGGWKGQSWVWKWVFWKLSDQTVKRPVPNFLNYVIRFSIKFQSSNQLGAFSNNDPDHTQPKLELVCFYRIPCRSLS